VLNGPYDTYLWDDLTTGQTNGLGSSQDFGVTVSIDGCYKRIHEFITVMDPFTIGLTGPFSFCPPDTAVTVSVPNPSYYDSVSWGLNDPAVDSLFTVELGGGTYTLYLLDSAGMCSGDTTFTISTQPPLVLQNDDATCDPTFVFTTNSGGGGSGTWSTLGNPTYAPYFANNNLNTSVTFIDYGVYSLMYTDASCGVTDTVEIIYEAPPVFNLDADFFVCPGEEEYLFVADSADMSGISWGITPASEDTLFAANIGVGTYTAQLVSEHGCANDTTFTITTQPQIDLYEYDHVCGDSIEFDQHLGIQTGQWTYFNSPGTINFRNSTELNTGLDVTEYGVYHLVFTELTCQNSDTIELNFIPYIGVDLNDSMELCVGQVVEIPSNIYYPEYTDNILWNTGATTSTISVGTGGYYAIEVSNICNSDTDSIYALMRVCDIELPNVFTPGNDPINGGWHLINPQDIFKEFHCVITNRWGNVVFEFDSYDDVWYGLDLNGNDLAEGVYFYTITSVTIDDNELNKQGFIHLER
jgi:gliding motility-associated-like protein